MPRRSTRAGDKFLNWRFVTFSSAAGGVNENNDMATDVLVASAHGKTRAWEIYGWWCNGSGIPNANDVAAAGASVESCRVSLCHVTGLAAAPEVGETGYIDTFLQETHGNGTDNIAFQFTGGADHQWRYLPDIYKETEVYIDDTLHIYNSHSYAAAFDITVSVAWKWITLQSSRLLELLQKYQ